MEADRLSRFATRQHHGWAYCTSASVCTVWRKYWLIIYITLWPKVIAQNRPKERQLTNMMAAAELCELIFRKLDLGATHISPCLSSLKSISGCSKLGNLTIMSNSQTTVITQLHSPINEFPTNKRMALRLRSIRLFVSPFVDSKGWQLQTTYHRGHAKVVRQSAAPSTARRARFARAKRSKAERRPPLRSGCGWRVLRAHLPTGWNIDFANRPIIRCTDICRPRLRRDAAPARLPRSLCRMARESVTVRRACGYATS